MTESFFTGPRGWNPAMRFEAERAPAKYFQDGLWRGDARESGGLRQVPGTSPADHGDWQHPAARYAHWLAREREGIVDAFNPIDLLIPSGWMLRGASAAKGVVVKGLPGMAAHHPADFAFVGRAFEKIAVDLKLADDGITILPIRVTQKGYGGNCVSCAIALDHTLGGAPSSALPETGDLTARHVERYFRRVGWRGAGPVEDVSRQLLRHGPGARAIVTAQHIKPLPGRANRHAFNAVVNEGGVVQYLDGQTGSYVDVTTMKAFWMLRTYP
jgi:hypothetical protein